MPGYPYPGPSVAAANEWDMYGIELALGDWHYQLDQGDVVYGLGLYPFHQPDTYRETDPSFPVLTREMPTGSTQPTSVRLSPDVAHYAWRNEYVALEPFGDLALLRMCLFAGRVGHKIMVRSIAIGLDLASERVTLPPGCPDALIEQATIKSQRVLALLRAARAERDGGEPCPKAVAGGAPDTAPDAGDGTAVRGEGGGSRRRG